MNDKPPHLPTWFLITQLFARVFVIPAGGMLIALVYSDRFIQIYSKNGSYDTLLMLSSIVFWPSLIVSGLSLAEVFKANKNG